MSKKPPKWQSAAVYVALRALDSGHLPLVLLLVFVLALLWVMGLGLDSVDKLAFAQGLLGGKLFGPTGWGLAVMEIPLCAWIIRRAGSSKDKENFRLQQENEKARVELEQMNLHLDAEGRPPTHNQEEK